MPRLSARERNIRAATIKLIEAEIRNYHQTVQDMRELAEAIAMPGVVGEQLAVQAGGHSDTTAVRAHQMMSSVVLRETRRRVDAIDYMLRVLAASPDRGRMELIRLLYWDCRYTMVGICDKLRISESTYRRWKREAIGLVAERLGWDMR